MLGFGYPIDPSWGDGITSADPFTWLVSLAMLAAFALVLAWSARPRRDRTTSVHGRGDELRRAA